MSLVEEPSQENDQKEPEMRLQEDDETKDFDPEDQKDQNMGMKDLLKTTQREKRSVSPLSLLKEDFSQLKEEVLKVFRDKDTKTENEDQAENKPASSALSLLKEDFSQFKEDVTSVFTTSSSKDKETKSADPKPSQSAEKTINRLSFFKGEFINFKDDLSNVFRIGHSKERDNKGVTVKEDASNALKIKVSKAERPEESFNPLSLFRREQTPLQTYHTAEDSQGGEETISETDEEQMDDGFKGNLSEQNQETVDVEKLNNNMKDGMNEVEDSELDVTASEEKTETATSPSETQQSEEVIPSSLAAEQRCESEEWKDNCSVESAGDERINEEAEEEAEQEEEEQQEAEQEEQQQEAEQEEEDKNQTLPWESSGLSLFTLRDSNKNNTRDQPGGDLWSVKNFACYLTFDPNTANSELHLTDCNRKATRVWSDHRPSDHPDQFESCPQVLCREGLLDSVYWEVVWSGGADIGITYNSISRHGDTASCLLGHNQQSWTLECSEGCYTPCHDNKRFRSSSPRPFTHRVGVYLDWFAGSLSFYCVSQDTMVHLHTFTSTFTEPLYPGFWVWGYDGSVSLCQVELGWERLLQ